MRNALILLGIGGFLAYHFGSKKITDIRNLIDQLQLRVNKINSPRISTNGVKFKIDLSIYNPTNTPINVDTANVVKLSKLYFYSNTGEFLGESYPNISSISIPSNGGINIPNLETFVKVGNIGNLINNALNLFSDPSKLDVKADIEAFGKIYTI